MFFVPKSHLLSVCFQVLPGVAGEFYVYSNLRLGRRPGVVPLRGSLRALFFPVPDRQADC